MVGGGPGSFIGEVHRKAIALDGMASINAGCFSAKPDASRETGLGLGIEPDRIYADWQKMARAEAARQDGIDFVVIVTPNHLHAPVAAAFLEAGIHVVCDKPLALSVAECRKLEKLAESRGLEFCVTYTYSGYPAVKQARAFVDAGLLGDIKFVDGEYPQEFFALPNEVTGNKQAEWRFDPARSGPAGTLGDVGTHVEHTVSRMTGLELSRVSARLQSLVPGRVLDDTATIMTEYRTGASGLYWACQAACGEGNDLKIRVYGTKGSLLWHQEAPDELRIRLLGEPERIWKRGRDKASPEVARFIRFPGGHPEGYQEAFANIYREFAKTLLARKSGSEAYIGDFPRIDEGSSGLRFVEACIESSRAHGAWTEL
jgi:predicted dehydrogenase